jgi:Zn-dependent protease
MIEFKLKSVTYRLDFSFFLLWAMVYLLGRERLIIPTFTACLVHELGHLVTIALSKRGVKSIEFRGTGIKITQTHGRLLPLAWDVAIVTSGCLCNFMLSSVIFILKVEPLYDLAQVSLSLGVFNALPIKSLDGYDFLQLIHT